MILLALSLVVPMASLADVIDQLNPGEWYEVPNSHLLDVVPSPRPCGGAGYSGIMSAWSGGAYDTNNERLLVWGGGHGDYGGNEIYSFSVRSLSWSRIWGPSPGVPYPPNCDLPTCTSTYSDGQPVSRHTYGGLAFLPAVNEFLAYGGSLFCNAGDTGHDLWAFDLDTMQWNRKTDNPGAIGTFGAVLAYDSVTGHVWLAKSSYWFYEYDPASDLWTLRYDQVGIGGGMSGAIDTKRHKFVVVGLNGVKMFDLNQEGQIPIQVMTTTGDTQIVGTIYPGVAYDPVSDRIVAWNGGASVYTLDMDTLVWTRRDPAPTNTVIPSAAAANGTFGRFRYIPSKNAYIAVNRVDENVYLYKLTSGSGSPSPADSVAPSAPLDLRVR